MDAYTENERNPSEPYTPNPTNPKVRQASGFLRLRGAHLTQNP